MVENRICHALLVATDAIPPPQEDITQAVLDTNGKILDLEQNPENPGFIMGHILISPEDLQTCLEIIMDIEDVLDVSAAEEDHSDGRKCIVA